MEPQYRTAVEARGFELIYYEKRIPAGTPPRDLAAVLIVVPICSHSLREYAEQLAQQQRAPVFHLRTASISAVKRALTDLREGSHPCG